MKMWNVLYAVLNFAFHKGLVRHKPGKNTQKDIKVMFKVISYIQAGAV